MESERGSMMPDPRVPSPFAWLDDHQIEPDREPGDRSPAGQDAQIEQPIRGQLHPRALAVIDRLLADPEAARRPPTHFHDDERARRTRVDRHEIELVATDMDVPGQDGPTSLQQPDDDERFGGVTCLLRQRPCRGGDRTFHADMVPNASAS
jgi:hypothetical protein